MNFLLYCFLLAEKGQLKTTFENCLKADQAEIFTVCERLIPMNEFLTQRQLQDLYIETEVCYCFKCCPF